MVPDRYRFDARGRVLRYRKCVWRAVISGLVWAGIAVILFAWMGRSLHRVDVTAWSLRGGILAAPFIGIAVGCSAPLFRRAHTVGRAVIALSTLYGSAYVFLIMSALWRGSPPHSTNVFIDSLNGTIYGLTWTGFVLVLAPLAYLNHLWTSRAWPPAVSGR